MYTPLYKSLDNHVCLLQLIFYAWFKFYFTLFSDMITSDNEFETKENLNQGLYWTTTIMYLWETTHESDK